MDFFEKYFDRFCEEPNSGCWLWIGSYTGGGYGNLTEDNESKYAHRRAFEEVHGEGSANGVIVRHRCDNPPCINPDHLLGGTHKDNYRDAKERGRLNPCRGSDHPRAVLSEEIVASMRAELATTHLAALARKYKIDNNGAYEAVFGKTWKHVDAVVGDRKKWIPDTRYAEKSPRAKFTNEQVLEIRRRLASGETGLSLSIEYGVCTGTISSIKTRRNWSAI